MAVKTYTETIAKVESTFLGVEDHGIFTAMVHVSYGGSGQGIGGYALDTYAEATKERHGTAYGMEWVRRFLNAAGVDSWEKLPGRTFIVLKDGDEWSGKVVGIKPLPTEKGRQFLFEDIGFMA